jgi:hypothetical protein
MCMFVTELKVKGKKNISYKNSKIWSFTRVETPMIVEGGDAFTGSKILFFYKNFISAF